MEKLYTIVEIFQHDKVILNIIVDKYTYSFNPGDFTSPTVYNLTCKGGRGKMIWFFGNKKEHKGNAWISPEKCTGCAMCLAVCPVKAIRLDGQIAMVVDSKCISCGICCIACPEKAIHIK